MGKLNSFVLTELGSEEPQPETIQQKILVEALNITRSVITGAEITDVRLLDNTSRDLYFAATQGEAWNRGSLNEISARKAHRFPVDETPATSAGAYVFQTGKSYSIPNLTKTVGIFYSEKLTFPGVTRIIVAPIKVGNKVFGVLDIRGSGKGRFSRNAESIADLLGRQLGLYQYLATTIGKLQKAELELQAQVQERIQTLEDLAHQIKSPIYQAQARVQAVLRTSLSDERLETSLLAIRGLTRKAKSVTMSTMLYSSLAKNKTIRPKLQELDSDSLIKILIEAASDNKLMIEPDRQISIYVERKSFEVLDHNDIKIDRDLLEQAINNLLDNAGKYSFNSTTVRVYGGLTASSRFHITVENEGLSLKPTEVGKCTSRGWRGDTATWTTGEGSGIGLWIVDNIMSIHKGELIIIPTDSRDKTEIKLVFPSTAEG
jgi:signal transduction histidine kinase